MILCTLVIIINTTSLPWIKEDDTAKEVAATTCNRVYAPERPCLKKFVKKDKLVYHAICGTSKQQH